MTALNAAILFNNSTGSDTTASGSSAGANVYGSGASTASASAVVTGVSTTGVQAGDLLWVQSSSGRQFSVIASVDSGTQVTCDDTFANTESSRTWAIGGKRATLNNADSRKLFDQSGLTGDAKAGMIVQLESGFTDTLTSRLDIRVAQDVDAGAFVLRADPAASVQPSITVVDVVCRGFGQRVEGIEFKNGSYLYLWKMCMAKGCKFTNMGISGVSSPTYPIIVDSCIIDGASSTGVAASQNGIITNSVIRNCGEGILGSNNMSGFMVDSCLIYNNTTDGIDLNNTRVDRYGSFRIHNNIIYGNGGSGIHVRSATSNESTSGSSIMNNIIVENTSFGLNFDHASASATHLEALSSRFKSNAFYNNTAGDRNNINADDTDITLTADPFVDSAASDFNIADNTAGNTLRASNFSINTDTAVYPFRQYVSDDFDSGAGGGATIHPLYAN